MAFAGGFFSFSQNPKCSSLTIAGSGRGMMGGSAAKSLSTPGFCDRTCISTKTNLSANYIIYHFDFQVDGGQRSQPWV